MMPRPTLPFRLRLLSGALALWLAPAVLDAPALHACPMHDALPASPGHGAAGTAGMAGMPGGVPAHAGLPGPHAHDAHVHGCTCLGACALSGAALPPTSAALAPVAPSSAPMALPVALPLLVRGAGAHFLPFAHAPPLLS